MELGNILSGIFENFVNILPADHFREYEGGVRYTLGIAGKNLPPGWHWHIPLIEGFEKCDITLRPIELGLHQYRTKDEKYLLMKTAIECRVYDPRTMFLKLQDDDWAEFTKNRAQDILRARVGSLNLTGILDHMEQFQDVTCKRIKKDVGRWGIEVERLNITETPNGRTLRLINEQYNSD